MITNNFNSISPISPIRPIWPPRKPQNPPGREPSKERPNKQNDKAQPKPSK